MSKIKIMIADDHAIFRAGLHLLINTQPDMEVIGEASDGLETVQKVRELKPDITLIDLGMPRLNGMDAIEEIIKNDPQMRILVLTMYDDPSYLRSVLAAGACGYILKKSAHLELLLAIRSIHHGSKFVDPSLGYEVIRFATGAKGATLPNAAHNPARISLSGRECEVLKYLAAGHTNKQIADLLYVSVKTVETYRARLIRKIGLRNRADLFRYAIDHGLLTTEKIEE